MSLLKAAREGFSRPFRLLAAPFVFLSVLSQYRRKHGWRYAAQIAYEIAFIGVPF